MLMVKIDLIDVDYSFIFNKIQVSYLNSTR